MESTMKRFLRTCLMGGALAVAPAMASAQPDGPRGPGGPGGPGGFGDPGQFFEMMDADGDGTVTREEFDTSRDRMRERFEERRGQRGGDGERGPRDGRGGGRTERLKEDLKATDEEWTVLEPMVEKVQDAQRDLRAGMGRGGRGFGGPGGPGGGNAPDTTVSELRAAIDSGADSAAVQAKLNAFREARKQKERALEDAQAELREVVTVEQEAVLVLNGYLE